MRLASTSAALGALLGALLWTAPAGAEDVDLRAVFARDSRPAPASAEQILRRGLDNFFGFDATVSIEALRKTADGRATTSRFLMQRRRLQGARRMFVISVAPETMRGTRVLQINYDDGREETYAYSPSMVKEPEPMRAPYRLAEPFLCTWHEIGPQESPTDMMRLADYEILAMEPRELRGEPAYRIMLRPLAGRGYEWSEFYIAQKDSVVLEFSHYLERGAAPALTATVPREDMVRFGERMVPGRVLYRDLAEKAEIEVKLRHMPANDKGEGLFFPRTFYRLPVPEEKLQ